MTRTLMRWLSLLTLFLLLSGAGSAIAAKDQIYTIKKGDTLWDLSKRFIDDPYYWPNIWSKIQEITNPHLIFPGQKIRVLDGRLEIIPAFREAEQKALPPSINLTPDEPGSQAEELITIKTSGGGDGFILSAEEALGLIVDSVDNRVLLTANDTVFIKMKDPSAVAVGDTYGLFEQGKIIRDPQTRKPIGPLMQNLGYVQVTEINGETVVAKIGDVFREVTRGAELFEYIPQRKEITLQRGTSAERGYLIASRDAKGTFSTNDIIYINLGSNVGVQSGNLIYISRPRKVSDEIIKKAGHIDLPDAVLGAAVIIEAKKETASAIIIKSVDAAFIGDKVSIVTD